MSLSNLQHGFDVAQMSEHVDKIHRVNGTSRCISSPLLKVSVPVVLFAGKEGEQGTLP